LDRFAPAAHWEACIASGSIGATPTASFQDSPTGLGRLITCSPRSTGPRAQTAAARSLTPSTQISAERTRPRTIIFTCSPWCLGSTAVLPYTSGPAAGKALYDCGTGNTWPVDATLAKNLRFGDTGTTTLSAYGGRQLTVPLVNSSGAMLFGNGTEPLWIEEMNQSDQGIGFAGSHEWALPTIDDLEWLFQDLQLQPGDTRFLSSACVGPFENLQPFFYWACERDENGNSQSPCNGMDAPTPPSNTTPMEWSFNFDTGF